MNTPFFSAFARNSLLTALSLWLLSLNSSRCAVHAMPEITTTQTEQSFKKVIRTTASAQYLLHLPKEYQSRGPKRWPLIIFLHGAGERGTNLQAVTMHGPPKIVKSRPDFPFVVVSPQCPPGERWNTDVLNALLDEILKKHKVDPKRVYLTGLSMGGFGSWSWAIANPERFAAVVPICGGGETIGLLLAPPKKVPLLKKLPIWAFHGAKDTVVRLSESEKMVDGFKAIGNQAKLTVYPEAGHDSWTATYDNPALYDWFLGHKR